MFSRFLSRLSFVPRLFRKPTFCFAGPRKYTNNYDVDPKLNLELTLAIQSCNNCYMLAELLKANLTNLTDHQLAFSLDHILRYELVLDEHFYNSFIPIVKEFVKNMDRECNRTLADIIAHIGYLKVDDNGLWKLFEQKLLEERLYRYFSIDQLTEVTLGISNAGRASKELFDSFEKVFVKHRLNLDSENVEKIKFAFENSKQGSNLLFKVLEDPSQDLTHLVGEEAKPKAIAH